MLASTLVVIFAMLSFAIYSYLDYRQSAQTYVRALGQVVTANLASALSLDDVYAAQSTLESFQDDPHVRGARLFLNDGSVVATFESPELGAALPDSPASDGVQIDHGRMIVYKPVVQAGDRLGVLVLSADWKPLDMYLQQYRWPIGIILMISMLVSLLLSMSLQRVIATPILDLAEKMKMVTHRKDYTVRAKKLGDDEVGSLIDGFNDMLEQITNHDRELTKTQERLEVQVERRTNEQAVTNRELKSVVEQLKEAKEAAESANHTKSQFLARMSHEIRTPMNGVLGMTDLLLHSGLSQRQRGLAETVYRSGEALLHIINDILDFSKIESGKMDLESVEFAIGELMEETLELLAEHAQKKGIELVGFADDAVPTRMTGDPLRLRQVLINLVGNAIKFTREGEVEVRVRALHEANDNAILKFEIRDTGIGIAPEAARKIFDPFSQADGSTTRKYGGTGLGLAICRQLALMMGGEIGVDSVPGEGATFWFTACFNHPVHSVGDHAASRDALSGTSVLVVAGNPCLADVLTHRLTTWGVKAEAVSGAGAAMTKLQSRASVGQPVQMVLVDGHLSQDGGLAFGREMRANPDLSQTRMVLLSPLTNEQDDEAASIGFSACVRKPVREAELYSEMAGAFGKEVPSEVSERMQDRLDRQGAGLSFQANILVAEDNLVNQEVVRGMLTSLGCQVTIAHNGSEAVEQVKDGNFDLVFMDCQMPVMDGFDATRAIKRLMYGEDAFMPGEEPVPTRAHLPVVALTANAMDGDREQCLSRGMDDYMSKPFRLDELEQTLLRWLPDQVKEAEAKKVAAEVPDVTEPVPESIGWESLLNDNPLTVLDPPEEPGIPSAPSAHVSGVAIDVPAEAEDSSPLDRVVIKSILGVQESGVPDLLQRVVASYFTETPKLLATLRESTTAGDLATIRTTAHALKSSSANVGGRALAKCCKDVEVMDDESLRNHAPTFLVEAEQEFEVVKGALRQELEGVKLT